MTGRAPSPSRRDIDIISRQMGGRHFDPAFIVGVARRCRWGAPQVLRCFPLRKGFPFPTTFWLSCPWLGRSLGTLESQGGVSSLEEFLLSRRESWRDFQLEHRILRLGLLSSGERRFLRSHRRSIWEVIRSGGVGGMRYVPASRPTVKCLHLQVASWLALGRHPGAEWLRDNVPEICCPDGRCVLNRTGT